jgi:hypothetical protein
MVPGRLTALQLNAQEQALCQAEAKVSQPTSPPGKRFRCRLGMHKWVARVNEEQHYFACEYCGKYKESAQAIFRYPGSRP